jgi:hypothetical protein
MTKRLVSLTLAAVLVCVATGVARAVVIDVTPSSLNGWQIDTYDSSGNSPNLTPGYAGTFVTGPAAPPLGAGSVRLQVGVDGSGAVKLQTANFNGTLLTALTGLSYSTYVTTNSGGTSLDNQQAPYVQIPVDWNDGGTTIDDRLFFEPVYQTGTYATDAPVNPGDVPDQRGGDGAAPKVGIWETYDILNGGFWTLTTSSPGGPPLTTLDNYVTLHPNATITNSATGLGLQFVAGFGGPGDWGQFDGNVDAVTIATAASTITYNFEAAVVPEASAILFGALACCVGGGAYVLRRRGIV